MLKLKVFSVGRSKDPWVDEGIAEYTKRLRTSMSIEWIWTKNDAQLVAQVTQQNQVLCLDPRGKLLDSVEFSQTVIRLFEAGGASLAIVIGGAEGLPEELRKRYPLISLSLMTFTHQLTRLVLIEQVYRALEISKGTPYHK